MIRKRFSKIKGRRVGVYTNLNAKRRANKDSRMRRKAEYLASLPKHPIKRTIYRMHPKRLAKYWFSRNGAIMALKITGVAILFMLIVAGALFAYFRRELDSIRPGELAKRVQTTVTKYYDRNGVLLWADKGAGNYKLVVKSNQISKYMKQATVAIEDKDFYKHGGVSPTGILRAAVNNFTGGSTQGGSTLTQQLVKQVFLENEASVRGVGGVPRKIKEAILAIEVERMYDKDQILTLYLNESPYGGRRNGVESGAQTYFGKHAKDLTIPESALLAAIPQQPGLYDPYNTSGHSELIERQHRVIDDMASQGYITEQQADNAKKVAILDKIQPASKQFDNIRAPHFVQMVRSQLEHELGKATVGRGGLVVKTTLDWRVQKVLHDQIKDLFNSYVPAANSFNDAAATIIDSQTGQILAMQGSRDYSYPGFGEDNASVRFIQPGSSVKPLVYSALIKKKPDGQPNYGAGSILSDTPIDDIYGAPLHNFDNRFMGNITVRTALANSRNIPAVKAMYLTGRDPTLQTIRDMGDKSYCTDGVDKTVGLAAAIGGCGAKQIEHANAFATLARKGVYKPVASTLNVKNSQGKAIKQWKDTSKQAIDPQIAYIISDILSDDSARAQTFGSGAAGFNVPGVKTATKSGTSNLGDASKDLWMNSYTPKATLSFWAGNNDSTPTRAIDSSNVLGPVVGNVMEQIHKNIFEKDGSWKPDEWLKKPQGIQTLNVSGHTDLFPSWYDKSQIQKGTKMTFDKVSKKKATDCTPPLAKVSLTVQKIKDPVTKKTNLIAPDGYDASSEDDAHKCNDVKPFGTIDATDSGNDDGTYQLSVHAHKGTNSLKSVEIKIDGKVVSTSTNYSKTYKFTPGSHTIAIEVTDSAYYQGSNSRTVTVKEPDPTPTP